MKRNTVVRSLIDVNILVALAIPEHPNHHRAHRWFQHEPNRKWATCPQTQAGFLRAGSILLGATPAALQLLHQTLIENGNNPNHEFWPDSIDLRDATEIFRASIHNPNQITSLQLLLLAHHHHAQLVTMDKGILELARGTRYANSVHFI